MAFRSLGNILLKSRQKTKFKKGLEKAQVFKLSREIINKITGVKKEALEKRIKFELKDKTLIIKCTDSYLAQELRFHQNKLRQSVDRRIGDLNVQRIRITVSKI